MKHTEPQKKFKSRPESGMTNCRSNSNHQETVTLLLALHMSEAIVGASLWIGTVLFSRLLVAGNSVPSSIPLVSTKANSKHVYHTLVVTRIHGISSLDKAMEGMLRDFVLRSRKYASMVLICIGAPTLEDSVLYNKKYRDYLEALDLNDGSVEVLPIFPWGSFTTALNIGLRRALDLQCYTRVIFQV